MTDYEYRFQRRRITNLMKKWVRDLGLRWWRVKYLFSRERKEGQAADDSLTLAITWVSWKYVSATITFYMPVIAEQDDEELEYAFVHECMHILVNEMREDGIEHEERVCTLLAKAFQWVREAGEEAGRKSKPSRKRTHGQ